MKKRVKKRDVIEYCDLKKKSGINLFYVIRKSNITERQKKVVHSLVDYFLKIGVKFIFSMLLRLINSSFI